MALTVQIFVCKVMSLLFDTHLGLSFFLKKKKIIMVFYISVIKIKRNNALN